MQLQAALLIAHWIDGPPRGKRTPIIFSTARRAVPTHDWPHHLDNRPQTRVKPWRQADRQQRDQDVICFTTRSWTATSKMTCISNRKPLRPSHILWHKHLNPESQHWNRQYIQYKYAFESFWSDCGVCSFRHALWWATRVSQVCDRSRQHTTAATAAN